jgi:hypothetical protein
MILGMFRRKKKFGGYIVNGVPAKEEKNRGAQILGALALAVLFVVPWLVVFIFHRHLPHPPPGSPGDRSTHATVALVAGIVVLDVMMLIVIALRVVRRS